MRNSNTLEDFGKKIGGARKDEWAARGLSLSDLEEMNDAEKAKYVKKDNIWKKPDYQAMYDAGMPREVLYYIKELRDSLPPKPLMDKDIEKYIKLVSGIRDAAMSIKSVDEIGKKFFNGAVKNTILEAELSNSDVSYYKKLWYASQDGLSRVKWNICKKEFLFSDEEKAVRRYAVVCMDENVRYEAWDRSDPSKLRLEVKVPGGKQYYYPNDLKENEFKKGTYLVFADSDRHNIVFKNIATYDEAKAKATELYRAANSIEVPTEKKDRKKAFSAPQLARIEFSGRGYRDDSRDITGQDYLNEFKFYGGEFGNWMNDADRQASMNFGYEAFKTIAEVLKVPDEDISFGGRLSIAFGSRGKGAAAAHYEPMREVINLTKMKGAGSLGHEYGHALDDLVNKIRGEADLSQSRKLLTIQNEIIGAMKYKDFEMKEYGSYVSYYITDKNGLHCMPIKSDFYENSTKFDKMFSKQDKGYWHSDIEMFARAFACYLHDKCSEAGIRCDYLNGSAEAAKFDGIAAIPQGEERRRLNGLFDKFIEELKEKEILHERKPEKENLKDILNRAVEKSGKQVRENEQLKIDGFER